MKKILASALALTMTAAMLTACGDAEDSSSKKDAATSSTTTTTTTTTTAAETEATTSAAESAADTSAADSSAEGGDTSATDGEGPKDISEMPATLKNYDNASVYFNTDMDVASFVAPMCEKNFENDESNVELTVEELAGIPMLRVQTLDLQESGENYKIPKVRFNVSKIFEGHEADMEKIFTVKADVVTKAVGNFVNPDDKSEALVPGNFMGAFCTQTGADPEKLSWNDLYDWGEAEWTSEWGSYELVMRPGIKDGAGFVNTTTEQYVTMMKWSIPNQADFYVADLVFEDEDGNVLACAGFEKK